MPRNVTVMFDDGSSHLYEDVPDDVPPFSVADRAKQEFGKVVKGLEAGGLEKQPTTRAEEPVGKQMIERLDPVLQKAKVAGAGLLQGALSAPTTFAEKLNTNPLSALVPGPVSAIAEGAGKLLGVEAEPMVEPGSIEKAVKSLDVKPQTPAERYLHSIGEGVGGAALLPLGGPVKTILQGAASGAGAQAADEASGGSTLAKLLGGLAGGGLAGIGTGALPQRVNVAQELMRDVDPKAFRQAVAGMQRNAAAGIPTNLSQTMPKASNLDSGVELLANSRHGKSVAKQLWNQPGQAELEMEIALSKLPGNISTKQEAANALQEASTNALQLAKKARTEAVTPLYEAVGELDKPTLKGLRDILAETAQKPGMSVETVKTIQALGRELAESSATGLPRSHALDVKAAIDDTIRSSIKNTANPVGPKVQGELKHLAKQLYETLGESVPELKKANALYKQITDSTISPLKQSVVGRMAGRAGYQADQEAVASRAFSVFNEGTPVGAKSSDILTLERKLRPHNPEAFQDAAKSWIAEKVTAAVKSDTARGPEDVSKEFVKAFGNPGKTSKEWNTTRDVLAGLALSEGKAANTYVDGFKSLMRLNAELAIRPGSARGITPSGLSSMAKDSVLTKMGSFSAVQPLRQPALALARLVESSVLKDVDKWLTTPEGAANLARLGKQQYMSPGWVKTVQTMLATDAVME